LVYGIRSDTQDFGREAAQADMEAHQALYPLSNKRALGQIQRGQVSSQYFHMLAVALDGARRCGQSIYSELGPLDSPDVVAEIADLFLRHEGVKWSCCWGYQDGRICLSVRSLSNDLSVERIVHRIVRGKGSAGGHRCMAAGQIPLDAGTARERDELCKMIRRRRLKITGTHGAAWRRIA